MQASSKVALISVTNKDGLETLSKALRSAGWAIVATGSTAAAIRGFGVECKTIDEVTGFPEILGGRVKTLHPAVFGGILAQRGLPRDNEDMAKARLSYIDLVVCNLYPFEAVLAKQGNTAELIENIDIGGVSLLRAAAKNMDAVAVLCDPADYKDVEAYLTQEEIPLTLRRKLAVKALRTTAAYDSLISQALSERLEDNGPTQLPNKVTLALSHHAPLRYGENPHQAAALYKEHVRPGTCNLAELKCLQGKELSYNNLLDIEHAIRLVHDLSDTPAAAILKHNVPCGVGRSTTNIEDAYRRAFESDTKSPFGGIVCVNETVTPGLAQLLSEIFLEVIIAPSFATGALEILSRKKNLRLVELDTKKLLPNTHQFTHVQGGFLVQSRDIALWDEETVRCVTKKKVPDELRNTLRFAYTVVKHVRSNAIVLANREQTIAIGGGFTNRIDALDYCLRKATLSLEGAVLASDAFFPFPDSIERLQGTGVTHIVQPGGSVQDEAVIAACDRLGFSMTFTGMRHFKH